MLPTPVALPSPPLRALIRDAQNAGDDGNPLILGEALVDVKALGVYAVMGAVGDAFDAVVDIAPPADWPLDVDYDGRADFTTGRLHLSLVWSARRTASSAPVAKVTIARSRRSRPAAVARALTTRGQDSPRSTNGR